MKTTAPVAPSKRETLVDNASTGNDAMSGSYRTQGVGDAAYAPFSANHYWTSPSLFLREARGRGAPGSLALGPGAEFTEIDFKPGNVIGIE